MQNTAQSNPVVHCAGITESLLALTDKQI